MIMQNDILKDIRQIKDCKTLYECAEVAESIRVNSVKHEKIATCEFIMRKICEYFSITKDQFESKKRKREWVTARQISHVFATKLTKQSLSQIGKALGQKDHSTVLHSCNHIKDLYEVDPSARRVVDNLIEVFRRSGFEIEMIT